MLDVTETEKRRAYTLPVDLTEDNYTPHLANFFAAVRGEESLHYPADLAFESIASVLKVNAAVEAGEKLKFKLPDFMF